MGRSASAPNGQGAPACWDWPLPTTHTFSDESEAAAFLAWWNHVCAICGSDATLVKDHDHQTMLVRGFLCISCNAQEGRSSDSEDGIFDKYRRRNPASMLGVCLRYSTIPVPTPIATAPPDQEDMDQRFAANLRATRYRLRLSQNTVSDGMRERGFRFHQQLVGRIELGRRSVSVKEMYALAEVLGISVRALTGDGDDQDDRLKLPA